MLHTFSNWNINDMSCYFIQLDTQNKRIYCGLVYFASGAEGPGENIAEGQPTDSSSTVEEDPEDSDRNCYQTEVENYPWWSVDLGQAWDIASVEIESGSTDGQFTCWLFSQFFKLI